MSEIQIFYKYNTTLDQSDYSIECQSLEEIPETLANLKNENAIVTSIQYYHLIHEHSLKLPEPTYYNTYLKENVYTEYPKIDEKERITIKIKDYKHKLMPNNNFEIRFLYLTKHPISDLMEKSAKYGYQKCILSEGCCYVTDDLQDMKRELYALSRQKNVYNLQLYQYNNLLADYLT